MSVPGRPLHYMESGEIADYLASLGVSSQGLRAVRENQVDGEMFMELTENDIKDLFSIFKDRHLVRKILQGKDNTPIHHSQPMRDTDFPSQPIISPKMAPSSSLEPVNGKTTITSPEAEPDQQTSRQYLSETKDTVTADEQIHMLQSYVKAINPSSLYTKKYHNPMSEMQTKHDDSYKSVSLARAPVPRSEDGRFSKATSNSDSKSEKFKSSRSRTDREIQSNTLYPSSDCPSNSLKELCNPTAKSIFRNPLYAATHSKLEPRLAFESAIGQFIHTSSNLTTRESPAEQSTEYTRDGNSSVLTSGDEEQDDSRYIPSVLTYRLTQFSGLELMSRKAKQGKPNEAQRLGQMVIREASSRAGIWDDPPCLQLLSSRQKQLFFEYSFSMAPNLREYKDLLWKRLGEALLNRRKYLRDKVLGKRGKRPGEDSASQDSPEPDDFEDQIPDTSTSPAHRTNTEESSINRAQWNRAPSSTVSRFDVDDYPVLILDDSADEDEKQAYPDSTMDNQYSMERESDTKFQTKSDLDTGHAKRKRSFTDSNSTSRNLSLLSSAACSALLREESEQGLQREIKHRTFPDYWTDVKEEEEGEAEPDPPQDIEKVNLHKRLFLSKYDSSSKHHHSRADLRKHDEERKPVLPVYDLPVETSIRPPIEKSEDTPEASVSPEQEVGMSGEWDSFVMEEVPQMRIYSTIDRGISHYTGEELLAKKSKQGKPSESQRLGQQVIRESAMMAKLWQDVPQSIRSITEEQKKVFFQCAFTLAPNLLPCKDMLWRRLGEALQNRRKYVRDRSLGKRPTKREQRLMKESLQHQESESDSQASLSSIQDIENTVRIKAENPDSCFLKP